MAWAWAYSAASWVLPTPPIPCTECTVTAAPAASARASFSSSGPRPVKWGFRAGTFHTCGNAPGNRAARGIARPAPGKPGGTSGLARPAIAADTMARSRAFAAASASPNKSTPTTPASSPGRSHSATRTVSSFRPVPCGSLAHAACHSAPPYTDVRYSRDRTAMVRAASRVPACMLWIQLVPGTKSHACTRTRWPSSSRIQAIHSAHARSAWV